MQTETNPTPTNLAVQLPFAFLMDAPKVARTMRRGWTRLSEPGDKCNALWRHDASGWLVQHCGHPTANWPYFAHRDDAASLVTAENGKGFRTLEIAWEAVEGLHHGTFTLDTSAGGAPRAVRVCQGGK